MDRLFDGVKDALTLYDTILIGGDLSATNAGTALSATVIGYVKKHIPRSGANIGDKIYVTGYLGNSACGLELLKKIKRPVLFEKTVPPTQPSPPRGEGKGGGGGLVFCIRNIQDKT